MSLLIKKGSSYKNKPNKNWPVGAIKNTILAGPRADSSEPLTKRNKGITVIGPAKISINDKFIFVKEKLISVVMLKL